MTDLPTYVLERTFDAPRELVWKTWTDPQLLSRWYGPRVETVVHRLELKPGGLWLFATPHPDYSLRRFKDRATDAIGKDQTHINVHPPAVWRGWCEAAGFRMLKHFGDGLWDVPYFPLIPKVVQFGLFGLPALAYLFLEFHGPRVLYSVFHDGSCPPQHLGGAVTLAAVWLTTASVAFKRFGWQ